MTGRSDPTVRRRRLAAELRDRRDRVGLTIEEVADRLEWSAAKVSRIENAKVSVLPRDVRFLMGVYGVEGEAAELLLTLSRESRQKGWWHAFGDAIPHWFQVYVGLESEATGLRLYESDFIPGLLQTEAYARASYEASLVTMRDEIDRQVALRMARQERLTGPDAPQLWTIINEAAIRTRVGGSDVMRAQLAKLQEAAGLDNVTVQVLPFSKGAHPAMVGAFHILSFVAPDPQVVYLEYYTGSHYLEKPAEVERYTLMYDHLRAAALPPDESVALIGRVAKE